MKKTLVLPPAIAMMFSLSGYGAEPDFFLNFDSCKSAVGYLVLSDESLKILEGEPTIMSCSRKGERISCALAFPPGQKGHKGNHESYKIVLDSPPLLYFATPNGSEFIAIDTSQHAAAIVTRVVGKQFAGSKVCQGLYATNFEMKIFQE